MATSGGGNSESVTSPLPCTKKAASPSPAIRKIAASCQIMDSAVALGGALWPKANETKFIKIMYVEVIKGNLSGAFFIPSKWTDIMAKMRRACPGYNYTMEQLKGKFYRLEIKWRKFHNLLVSATGFQWDDAKDLITASNECWSRWLEVHPKDRNMRWTKCLYFCELTTLFLKRFPTGGMTKASTQPLLPHSKGILDINVDMEMGISNSLRDSDNDRETDGHTSQTSLDSDDDSETYGGTSQTSFDDADSHSHQTSLRNGCDCCGLMRKALHQAISSDIDSWRRANDRGASDADAILVMCSEILMKIAGKDTSFFRFFKYSGRLNKLSLRLMFLAMDPKQRIRFLESLPDPE